MTQPSLYYGDYLQLDRLLSLQSPESAKHGPSVHDEMLFIRGPRKIAAAV
jgi:tryptophan 2,3-dioxygenase